jgi:predicted flap endonuclease-1-like 5' DNA nuclease
MSYLVQQLWTTLLIAFVIGAVFGWLFKSWAALRLQIALKDAVARQNALQADQSKLRDELKDSRERQRNCETEVQSLRNTLASNTPQTDSVPSAAQIQAEAVRVAQQARILALETQQVDASAVLASCEGQSAQLQIEVDTLRSSLAQEQRERAALVAAAHQSFELTNHLQQQHQQLAQALSTAQDAAQVASSDPQLTLALRQAQTDQIAAEQDNAALRSELAQTHQALSALRQLLPAAAPSLPAAALQSHGPSPGGSPDDLQLIRGVGPKIARRLHELGVYSFRQIALADRAELDRLARALPGFASRIGREDWPGQCMQLHRDKYGSVA